MNARDAGADHDGSPGTGGTRGPDAAGRLSSALNAKAGGGRRASTDAAGPSAADSRWWERFTLAQLVLIAAIVGAVIGIAAGFIILTAT